MRLGFATVLITPIAAGYHFDAVNHISFSLPIYVPTGAYNDDRLANPGQNTYTFMPTVAFTHLDGKGGEFTLSSGLEFYTENDATDYRNGNIFTLDALWTHGFGNGWSAGVVGGYIQQITDDKGQTADSLNGFRGRSVGAGPVVGWAGKFADAQASVSAVGRPRAISAAKLGPVRMAWSAGIVAAMVATGPRPVCRSAPLQQAT